MDMIKYLPNPDPETVGTSEVDMVRTVIESKDSKLMTLGQFQNMFNNGDIDDTGLIAIVPPIKTDNGKRSKR